tara:strand:+ start:4707 stop:5225 length:519 start_codon:yes stop_codon:yes gene_type:complete
MDFYNTEWIDLGVNKIHKTAVIFDNVTLGKNNIIGPYTVIGSNGEIRGKKFDKFEGTVIIGDNNVISEHVTIQRPYWEDGFTVIGDGNIIMAHSHIGHDAVIGDNTEICTSTVIGGYAKIGNGTKVKLKCVIRNRIEIGENCIIGMGSAVTKDIPSGMVAYGVPAKITRENG